MSETNSGKEEDIELEDYERQKLQDLKNQEDAINGRISDIELQIKQLKERKEELLEEKSNIKQRKQDAFEGVIERHNLDPTKTYQIKDGKLVNVNRNEMIDPNQGGI